MTGIASILVGVAAKVGAPIVKRGSTSAALQVRSAVPSSTLLPSAPASQSRSFRIWQSTSSKKR
ncbi:hypothetical protein C0V73_15690 [Rhizobium sp. TH135]|uniref:hypothetical protein n=1 Tax=Rhizobium sp. TH135 TaxID=2067451 RepID=UPI000C7C9221|nr:hypothetical protein [Rhizobium sp. TH135]PLK69877.1 hypothetical protein C0V73_15690 [Rhizobium sp. TH135]